MRRVSRWLMGVMDVDKQVLVTLLLIVIYTFKRNSSSTLLSYILPLPRVWSSSHLSTHVYTRPPSNRRHTPWARATVGSLPTDVDEVTAGLLIIMLNN